MKKLITSLLAAALLVSSVPALAETDKPKAAEQIYYNVYSSDWPSLNYMYESSADLCANFIDTLVEYDNYGILQPCLAESWECSEDGLIWTFHLRKGVKWMTADMEEYGADVVADDFVYSASRILDSSLTQVSNTSDILYVIKNAEAYFNGECDWEDVGVKAIDDYTLEYTLEQPVAYFESMLREFLSCFPLIFRAFPAFCLSVIRCADHKKRPFFIQRQADETHHLLPQTTPLVYCTSLLHKCP